MGGKEKVMNEAFRTRRDSMKKNLLFIALIAALSNCTNHDTVPNLISEKPTSSLVESKEILIYKYNNSYSGAALGLEFKVKANGYLTGFGCASPAIGHYTLSLFKVDTVNKIGTLIANLPISIAANDTVNFKFKYVYLSTKVALLKGNYYRVAMNGDFTAYDYLAFPSGSKLSLPLSLPTDPKVIFTKGVAGYANSYPDTEYSTYMFPADVVVQFP